MKFSNVYFINGLAYAGKSTMVKLLAKKYDGIACEENYHDQLILDLDSHEFPNLTYTRDLKDFSDFIRRSPDEYEKWIDGCIHECTILELKILEKLSKTEKKIFVDTNIPIETLREIADKDHVLIMLTDIDTAVSRFFEREDKEKQFLYQLILKENDPKKALDNFKKCLERINSKENYDKYLNSGFKIIIKDEKRSIEETCLLLEEAFRLK